MFTGKFQGMRKVVRQACTFAREPVVKTEMLSGRVAFVTGGGSGIGRATCQVLAREDAHVVVVDINDEMAKETLKLLPGNSHSVQILDVSDGTKVESAVETVIGRYNVPPTIVVNCAGIYHSSPAFEIKSEDFDRVIDVNVKVGSLFIKDCLLNFSNLVEENYSRY